ncbi:hypothetical protein [Candidatus Dormiibacter inghamiae]|uniref:hypothetical protein n=1 Tax=Candidatus Dormiibacter inghamiae TaxID=3127013 RepID=UPI001A1E1392|nr:hypothetical protein [Candidatus Dormibacteraeota bacterium]
MFGFAAFFLVLALRLLPLGVVLSFALALLARLGVQGLSIRLVSHSGAAGGSGQRLLP